MTTIRFTLLAALGLVASGCDYNITFPSPNVAVTTTNTNTNTVTQDSHDAFTFMPTPPGVTSPVTPGDTGTSDVTLPIPPGSEAVVSKLAAANPALIAQSCQATYGPAAWGFMDLVVTNLRGIDPRWGYLCRDASCTTLSQDVIAYRATNDTVGVWGVDIIGAHCGPSPSFTWNPIGFDPSIHWTATRP